MKLLRLRSGPSFNNGFFFICSKYLYVILYPYDLNAVAKTALENVKPDRIKMHSNSQRIEKSEIRKTYERGGRRCPVVVTRERVEQLPPSASFYRRHAAGKMRQSSLRRRSRRGRNLGLRSRRRGHRGRNAGGFGGKGRGRRGRYLGLWGRWPVPRNCNSTIL